MGQHGRLRRNVHPAARGPLRPTARRWHDPNGKQSTWARTLPLRGIHGACQNYAPQWYLSANSIHRPPSTISCISQTVPTHQQLAAMILVQSLVSFATSLAHFLDPCSAGNV